MTHSTIDTLIPDQIPPFLTCCFGIFQPPLADKSLRLERVDQSREEKKYGRNKVQKTQKDAENHGKIDIFQ
ncbi:hypothetical protein PMAC_001417 [Pneumocystis sp. 'macacae']|nr:hypothetical protein PMAC_001417 [Pneumocystis sp. 'macacae']